MQIKFRYPIFFLLALLAISSTVFGQKLSEKEIMDKIAARCKNFDGKVGVGVIGLDFSHGYIYNDTAFPMQSVYKFPLAIYVLHLVDDGVLKLDQTVSIDKKKLDPETWSPMMGDFKTDTFNLSLSQLLLYTVSKSDNNACDILFELAGGPAQVSRFFNERNIQKMSIAATEAEMHANWDTQYSNWCNPSAMITVLMQFYAGSWLKPGSNALLMKLMTESENSPKRIKGKLPKKTVVAHKTGTGSVDKNGIRSATNDIGIVTLPDGRHYALVIFLSNYKDDLKKGEGLIADISRIVWDSYTR